MSTWQIFSDAGNTFRWEISDQRLPIEEPNGSLAQESSNSHRLPSMADLLLQGCSRLMENRDCNPDNTPVFRTGLGKSVEVKQSSISRALAILGDEGEELTHTGYPGEGQNAFLIPNTMSWTSSVESMKISNSMLQTGTKETTETSNSLFQTGSGKTVNISSAGLLRAKTLLGLEENCDPKNVECFEKERIPSTSNESFGWRSSAHLDVKESVTNISLNGCAKIPTYPLSIEFNSLICEPKEVIPDLVQCAPEPPSIKFHTAGGRSISVSSDALQRARSLLGDLELGAYSYEENGVDPVFSSFREGVQKGTSSNKGNYSTTPFLHQGMTNSHSSSKNFTSPLRSNVNKKQSCFRVGNVGSGSNLIKKFDAEANESRNKLYDGFPCHGDPLSKKPHAPKLGLLENSIVSKVNQPERSLCRPLVDISNNVGVDVTDIKCNFGEKRKLGKITVSPFKRPRTSKFVSPLNKHCAEISNGMSPLARKQPSQTRGVSAQFPFQVARLYMKEYIRELPSCQGKPENLPESIRNMNPDTAEKYVFHDAFCSQNVGVEAFHHMLAQSGASSDYVSQEWVANHFRWIVWKLASYERCYPTKFSGKMLTVSNVLEELKYRYEREVNHGHRSAIKRILQGDTPPSTRMVLCISSVCSNCDLNVGHQKIASGRAENGAAARIELTDGWYSIGAHLDLLLSKKLATGKLFVGQKLMIWGAGLCAWGGPVSPLEESRATSLLLHINGTYRAHWADRLGFCKGGGLPLAFRSIKRIGGIVPSTLVGILRIYPVLYRERLSNGGFIVRSERMETKMLQLYNQRRSTAAEGIMSEFQRGNKDIHSGYDNDSEEGAKILKILETAAEPEVLMAEMTSEQLASFASYQAKLEAIRQSDMQKSLEKALEAAGLSGREVTPFMRIRVVGLTSKSAARKCSPQAGLITIWNPTEKQRFDLVEGQVYAVAWLMPLSSDSSTLHLQAWGSSTEWLPLSPLETEHFEPFFSPRKSVVLSNLGEVPLSSEFDVAAYVVYVGDAYTTARHKKQWVFVTDGSIHESHSREPSDSLLAICFWTPFSDSDSFAPVNQTLAGSTVGFCNLIKRSKDQVNNFWVAEATENSTYSLTFDPSQYCHLKDVAASAQKWANVSSLTIENFKRRVLSVIGNSEA